MRDVWRRLGSLPRTHPDRIPLAIISYGYAAGWELPAMAWTAARLGAFTPPLRARLTALADHVDDLPGMVDFECEVARRLHEELTTSGRIASGEIEPEPLPWRWNENEIRA